MGVLDDRGVSRAGIKARLYFRSRALLLLPRGFSGGPDTLARLERDREDLMRDATALVERVELVVVGECEPVVAGFHRDGRLSLYFGPDPVFHFDALGKLRRAFCDGDSFRSQGRTLARLRRARREHTTDLERHDLDESELERFLGKLRTRLRALELALGRDEVAILRQVSGEHPVGDRLGGDLSVVARLRERLPQACVGLLAPATKK